MGPGGCGEPGRTWPVAGPHVAIVSSAELAAQPGAPLAADYWVNRLPGEPWTAYRVRRQAEDAERRAAGHEAHALHLRAEAGLMRLAAGLMPPPGPRAVTVVLTGDQVDALVMAASEAEAGSPAVAAADAIAEAWWPGREGRRGG
jgi:hypothetical protein